MTRKSAAPVVVSTLPDPCPETKAAITAATARKATRPARAAVKTKMVGSLAETSSPHCDEHGWGVMLKDALGTSSNAFAAEALSQVSNALRDHGEVHLKDSKTNFALAAIGAIAPADEFETMIAVQLVAAHALAMDCTMRAGQADNIVRRDSYINQATKLSRTFGVLTESLVKLRSGGKQQVEVRYVYVDQRTQTVVNGGGGGQLENHRQPLEHIPSGVPGGAFAFGPPMFGQEPEREAMPSPCEARAQEMPPTRGELARRA